MEKYIALVLAQISVPAVHVRPTLTPPLSYSHIYQPVVDSLVHVATHLKDKQQRFELLDMSMQLFVQQGIEARRASEVATFSRKVLILQNSPCIYKTSISSITVVILVSVPHACSNVNACNKSEFYNYADTRCPYIIALRHNDGY